MLSSIRNILAYRELLAVLAWKNIAVRYKQAYLGVTWAIMKPVMLVVIFSVMRTFIGIDSGDVPYAVLVYAALVPWIFFQESTSEGVTSVVGNAHLIRKIYFPREIFPLTTVLTKLVEMGINFVVLLGLMAYHDIMPTAHMLWVPLIIFYTVLAALSISFAGAALNVYYRDVSTAVPVLLSLMLYLSPIIYPLTLVKDKLLVQQAAGEWSHTFYTLYTLNPVAGIVDAFQRVMLKGVPPDFNTMLPGMILIAVLLPLSYALFKRAESHFADVV